jgi:hypothetical protein
MTMNATSAITNTSWAKYPGVETGELTSPCFPYRTWSFGRGSTGLSDKQCR